jgi:hypothetical protein
MWKDAPRQALAEAQERLIGSVCGPRWAPVHALTAPFACPKCQADRLESVDAPRLKRFLDTYVDGAQPPEPGAGCTGGVGAPAG